MIDYSPFGQIHLLHEQKGLKASQIAQDLSLNPKTVEKWIAPSSFKPWKSAKRSSKLDPFKGQIVALSEIYGPSPVARALQEALRWEAMGCEYIAHVLEQRPHPAATPPSPDPHTAPPHSHPDPSNKAPHSPRDPPPHPARSPPPLTGAAHPPAHPATDTESQHETTPLSQAPVPARPDSPTC